MIRSAVCALLALGVFGVAMPTARSEPIVAAPASAAPIVGAPAPVARPISQLEAADLLIKDGQAAAAIKILDPMVKRAAPSRDALFLRAMAAAQLKDYRTAIRLLRRLIILEPKALRVRLELARAFFEAKDFDNAQRQFERAAATHPPSEVYRNIEAYLGAIREARIFDYHLQISAAPDTNFNAGPAIDYIDLFGLPFSLSKDTQKHSGTGLSVSAGMIYTPRLSASTKMLAALDLSADEYGAQKAYDDENVSVSLGVQRLWRSLEGAVTANTFRRWYGPTELNSGVGAQAQLTWFVSPQVMVSQSLSLTDVNFRKRADQSGLVESASTSLIITLSPEAWVRLGATPSRQWAGSSAFADTSMMWQLTYGRDLPFGLSATVQAQHARSVYTGIFGAFGRARRDRYDDAQLTLLNRHIELAGFTPRVSYSHGRNASNIGLYAFSRDRYELGVTRVY